MKKVTFYFLITMLCNCMVVAQSWKSPEYKQEKYRKVLVLAKTSDDLAKRQIEDATVKMLAEKGIVALSAYSNIKEADLANENALIKKADELEVDALIVYTVTGSNTSYKNTPSVNMIVGVPIRMGIFEGFLGGNVPIAGGTKTVNIVSCKASFYNRSSKSMLWSHPLSGKLKKGTAKLAADFAKTTVKAMFESDLFIQ